MARGRKGGSAKNSIKVAAYGKQGTRKSNFLADFAKMTNEDGSPMKVLYLDPENGSIDGFALDRLMEEGVDVDNIYIVYTSAYDEIEEYCDRAIKGSYFYEIEEEIDRETGETEWNEAFGDEDKLIRDAAGNPFVPDAICLDGITVLADEVGDAAINLSEKRAAIRADAKNKTADEKEVMIGTAGLEFKDHSKMKQRGKKLIYRLLKTTDKHVGITLRAKDEKKMEKNGKGEMVLTATGREIPEAWAFILYDVYTVVHTYNDAEGNTYGIVEDKDRSGMFEPGTELTGSELSVASWQEVIEKNKDRKVNVSTKARDYDDVIHDNETAYQKMVGEKVEVKPDKKDIDDLPSLIAKCEELKNNLPSTKKRSLKSKLEKAGLPTSWKEADVTMEVMNEIYTLLSS